MLIATAGHIDHGKTALIHALTGIATDRLPEEQARGISIDLGFAYWPQDDGRTLGFVDVPGHERFIRNMLAGLCGIDAALLVVAADDGVMPQTVEHFRCLVLLGLTKGVVAITKCDRASPEQIATVTAQIADLVKGTGFATAPVIPLSAHSGQGMAVLAQAIAALAETPWDNGRNFRMAIDRCFAVTGVGTVVTGTVLAGLLEPGSQLMLAPKGLAVRVRGLQSAGLAVASAQAGQRCAINLAGVDLAQISRGDWLVCPAMHAPSSRIVARITAIERPLRHSSTVQIHHATARISGRILTHKQASIAPEMPTFAQIVFDHPISAVAGERFILRDASGQHLLGGGIVLDPYAIAGRRGADWQERASAYARLDPAAALAALMEIPGHEVDCHTFARCFNLTEQATAQALITAQAEQLGKGPIVALSSVRVSRIMGQIIAALAAHHTAHPELNGIIFRDLRQTIAEQVSPASLLAILTKLAEQNVIERSGAQIRLSGHQAQFSDAERALWRDLRDWLDQRGPLPFTQEEALAALHSRAAMLTALLLRRTANGDVLKFDDRRFILREHFDHLAAAAARLDAVSDGQGFTAAQLRDATGIGRNMVIRIVEFFDRTGITRRHGDHRRMARDYRIF